MDCTKTFNDLLDSDKRDDTENFQDQMESAVQPQQANNSCELQSENNSGKRKQDFDAETSLKTPTKVNSSKRNSTSHWMFGTHSSRKQCSKDPEHRNSIPRLEDNGLCYASAVPYAENQMPILEANPVFPYPGRNNNKNLREAFRSARQLQNKFQNAYPLRNEPRKENSQLIYGQSFATNILKPSDVSDYAIDYSKPFSHDRINAFKSIENDPKLQKCNALHRLHPSKTNPHSNKRVGNQEILNPSVSQQTDDLNYGMKNEITVDKEIQLLGQNKLSSTDLVSETELQDDNRDNFPISLYKCNFSDAVRGEIQHINDERRIVKNYQEGNECLCEMRNTSHASEQQKNAELRTTQQKHTQHKKAENCALGKHVEKRTEERDLKHESAEQESNDENAEMVSTNENAEMVSIDESAEMVSIDESAEMVSTDESAEMVSTDESAGMESTIESAKQENAEKSGDQENAKKSGDQENAKKCDDQENAEKSGDQENAKKCGDQENAKKCGDQENAKKCGDQENAEKSGDQKNVDKCADQKNGKKSAVRKNAKKSAVRKNAKKSAVQKNSEQENAEKSAVQKNSEQENAEKSVEQENSNVFTGKGYDSLEDFIKALYNNTLYKRY